MPPLNHHWSHVATPLGPGFNILVADSIQLITEKGFSARAALGEAEVIEVIVDDPEGIYDFKKGNRWAMLESAITEDVLVWNGYISDQHILRGDDGDTFFITGPGRRWHLEISQENIQLAWRIIWDTDGKRPAETPAERLEWLLGSDYLTRVQDHGLIDWDGLASFPDMDKNDYRPGTPADVLRDISLITGYNHYARYRHASTDIELAMYDANTSELDTSELMISNDEADIDPASDYVSNMTWPPVGDTAWPQLDRKGDRVAYEIAVQYAKGFVHGVRPETGYEFEYIGQVVQASSVKSPAAAGRLLNRLLTQHSTQDRRITNMRIQLKAAELNLVKHGQRIQVKQVHLPESEAFGWWRVVSKSIARPDNESQELYDVDLELSPQSPTESVFCCLSWPYRHSEVNDAGGRVTWDHSGDNPASGDPPYPNMVPTSGPIEKVYDPAPVGATRPGWGFARILGEGTINVSYRASMAAVLFGETEYTITWVIALNGVEVASDAETLTGDGYYEQVRTVTISGLEVVNLDEIEAWVTITPSREFLVPAGTGGSDERMVITGSLVAA